MTGTAGRGEGPARERETRKKCTKGDKKSYTKGDKKKVYEGGSMGDRKA